MRRSQHTDVEPGEIRGPGLVGRTIAADTHHQQHSKQQEERATHSEKKKTEVGKRVCDSRREVTVDVEGAKCGPLMNESDPVIDS